VTRQTRGIRAIALALSIVLTGPALAQGVRVPGTNVSLTPPPGFVAADRFAGFQNAQTGSSIVVTEIPAPANEMRASLTRANLQAKGMTLKSSEPATIGGRNGVLIAVTQVANGIVFEKWMAVTGDSSTSILLVATYPQSLAGRLGEPMRRAVLSSNWNPSATLDRFEGLPFRVQETADLKFANRVQNMLLMAKPGSSKARSPADPIVVVGPAHSPVQIPDLERFAKQRIAQTAEIRDLANLQGQSTTIAGRPAYEITASAKDQKSGAPLAVYQAAVIDGSSYYLVVGMVGESGAATYVPQFKTIAQSLKLGQ
jgi:hypothetical protein